MQLIAIIFGGALLLIILTMGTLQVLKRFYIGSQEEVKPEIDNTKEQAITDSYKIFDVYEKKLQDLVTDLSKSKKTPRKTGGKRLPRK